MSYSKKLVPIDTISSILDPRRADGDQIALCHGVFDLLHPGHVRHLAKARESADCLVVSITADRFVNKGPGRPAFPEDLRAEALAALEAVDYVIITAHETALPAITEVKPDVYVKGGDYSDEEQDLTGNIRRERELVELNGGRLLNTNEIVFSSSGLINRYLPQQSESARNWIEKLREGYSLDDINGWIDRIEGTSVTVVGETILDVYTRSEALGKSSKDPVLCFRRGRSDAYLGGVMAIAGHCVGLGAQTTIVTGLNGADFDDQRLNGLRLRGVSIDAVDTVPRPTIRKERFIDEQTDARVFELYDMDDTPLAAAAEKEFNSLLRVRLPRSDLTLVADYGHGLIGASATKSIADFSRFLAVNTQVNAGNRGFNNVTKYPRADFVSLNAGEALMEVRRRHIDFADFVPGLRRKLGASSLLVTRGSEGIDVYTDDGSVVKAPALAPFVKDRVGAGDAVLSIAAILSALDAPPEIVGFLGNLVGAWAVSFLGNEQTLDRTALKKQAAAVLK